MRKIISTIALGAISTIAAATIPMPAVAAVHTAAVNTATGTNDQSYGLGKVYDGPALAKLMAAHVHSSDPASYPLDYLKNPARPDNSGTKHPDAFTAKAGSVGDGNLTWFGAPENKLGVYALDGAACPPRNQVLTRDLIDVKLDADGCTVVSGTLVSPFVVTPSGDGIQYTVDSATGYDIAATVRPVVPLAYAYATGADKLDADTRLALANDPLNMYVSQGNGTPAAGSFLSGLFGSYEIPTDVTGKNLHASINSQGWLPSTDNDSAAPETDAVYAARFAAVMMKYGLKMEPAAIEKFTALMGTWKGTLDTTPAGLEQLAKSSFRSTIPGNTEVKSTTSASSSASASASETTAYPSIGSDNYGQSAKHPDNPDANSSSSTKTIIAVLVFLAGLGALLTVAVAAFRGKRNNRRDGVPPSGETVG